MNIRTRIIYKSVHLSIHRYVYLSNSLTTYPSIYPPALAQQEGHIRGGLGRLSTGVLQALGGQEAAHNHAVEVVSVYGRGDTQASRTPPTHESSLPPTTCVWVSVRKEGGDYVDPIKLAGILELHAYKVRMEKEEKGEGEGVGEGERGEGRRGRLREVEARKGEEGGEGEGD